MSYGPIYTERTECRDCYKCVRVCPVKAIQVEHGSAVVIHDRCIFCGKCVDVCPANAKKIRNDVPKARRLLQDKAKVFASLAPSYVAEFAGTEHELIRALKKLGFAGISETALGADIVSAEIDTLLQRPERVPLISSACPTIVEAVRKYYPEMVPYITQLRSPLGAHSLMLRELYGDDIGIVFIGPCISKKLEADRNRGLPDVVLTFGELMSWLSESGIDLHNPDTLQTRAVQEAMDPASAWFGYSDPVTSFSIEAEGPDPSEGGDCEFVPRLAYRTTNYALEHGMISSLDPVGVEIHDAISISGITEALESIKGIAEYCGADQGELQLSLGKSVVPGFLELLSCPGGCINGPGCTKKIAPVIKKVLNTHHTRKRMASVSPDVRSERYEFTHSIVYQYQESPLCRELKYQPSEAEIRQALNTLGKSDGRERLDCGGCGYNSCRDFAIAFLTGMAEPEMCVTKMRKQAQSKVDVLLRTLPMGVVIVDDEYAIVDCNAQFLKMFSSITYDADETELGKVSGIKLNKFINLDRHFTKLFSGRHPVDQQTVHHGEKIITITFFSIDRRRLAGALFQDVTAVSLRRDAVMKRAEEVIQKNLQSVQQIASLLGENAAETEILLSSMIDVFEVPDDEQM